jgi:hypothetical protein
MLLSCAHHERPAREPDSAERIKVKEEGTWREQPYVTLAFRPLVTDAARYRLTPEEARAFVEALEEANDYHKRFVPWSFSGLGPPSRPLGGALWGPCGELARRSSAPASTSSATAVACAASAPASAMR